MKVQRKILNVLKIITDLFAIFASYNFAIWFSDNDGIFEFHSQYFLTISSLIIIWLVSSGLTSLYDEFRTRNIKYAFHVLMKNYLLQCVSIIILKFFYNGSENSRILVLVFAGILLVLLSVDKYLFHKILETFRIRGRNLRMLLVIGTGKVGMEFFTALNDNPKLGYRIQGFLDDIPKAQLNGLYLGKVSNLESILSGKQIDEVIVALPSEANLNVEFIAETCRKYSTRVQFIPEYFRFIKSKYNISTFGQFPVISLDEGRIGGFVWRFLKRTVDILFSFFLFVTFLWWLWPLIALSIRITSSGKAIFKQERWGRDNQRFYTYKFRTMIPGYHDTDSNGKYQPVRRDDPRLTKLGYYLRKLSLDELPQFWNVIKGEMSVVGPRPHPVPLNIESRDKIELYMLRHLVKPGITGWAQVNGYRGEIKNEELLQKRVDHDLWYIKNWTPWLDIKIIIITLFKMVQGDPEAY